MTSRAEPRRAEPSEEHLPQILDGQLAVKSAQRYQLLAPAQPPCPIPPHATMLEGCVSRVQHAVGGLWAHTGDNRYQSDTN